MAYDDRKKGLYTLRAKGQGGVNDKSSSLLLTYPYKVKKSDEVIVLLEEFRENSVVRMFEEASDRSISKKFSDLSISCKLVDCGIRQGEEYLVVVSVVSN